MKYSHVVAQEEVRVMTCGKLLENMQLAVPANVRYFVAAVTQSQGAPYLYGSYPCHLGLPGGRTLHVGGGGGWGRRIDECRTETVDSSVELNALVAPAACGVS